MIEKIIAQRVTNAIEAIAIYEARTHVTRDSMDQVARQGAKVVKDVKNKRKWENGYDRKSSQQQANKKRSRKLTLLDQITREVGHQEKDCRVRAFATGCNSKPAITCYGCGKQGHYKNRFLWV
nr:hypothetical protein [Tanacetum cinerariifolium]